MQRQYFEVDESRVEWITSGREDNNVVLWERSAAHPGGEVLIGGRSVVQAALTPRVVDRLADGQARFLTPDEAAEAVRKQELQRKNDESKAKADRREVSRQLYIQAVGSDKGFDQAYKG